MSFESTLSNLKESSARISGSKKVSQIRVFPSSAVSAWDTSTRLIQYFMPPNRVFIPGRSGLADIVNVPVLGAADAFCVNPAVNSRWLSARLQIGGTEVMNISNLNNGYSRIVRDACQPAERFYSACRLGRSESAVGAFGSAYPSEGYPGSKQLLTAVAAIPTPAQFLAENQNYPKYYVSNTNAAADLIEIQTPNTPADIYVNKTNAASTFRHYTDFCEFYGTALCIPQGLPTGNGSVLEMVQDSVGKTFSDITAGATNVTLLADLVAAPTALAGITVSGHHLRLTVLANDGVENAEDAYYAENEGVEINMPYLDQINQGAAAGTTYSTNVVLPVAGRHVRAVCAGLVLPATNNRTTQCNGSNGTTIGMLSARATLNGVPDTNDVLNLNDNTLAQWNISNSLVGSSLNDSSAYMSHPIYVSNLSGMPLVDLHRPANILTECGKYFDSPLVYQLEGSMDAVARSVQFYLLSSKKAKISRQGISM